MNLSELSESPELNDLRNEYALKGVEFEPALESAYERLSDVTNLVTPSKAAVISFIINYLTDYLIKQIKPKRKGWQIVKAILTVGISLWVEKRKK